MAAAVEHPMQQQRNSYIAAMEQSYSSYGTAMQQLWNSHIAAMEQPWIKPCGSAIAVNTGISYPAMVRKSRRIRKRKTA